MTGYDNEKIYCQFSSERSFTILERMPRSWRDKVFVKNGKLYSYNDHKLMVFDIRSGKRMRKLGHFVRTDFRIEDIAVLENGNILMCLRHKHKLLGSDVDKSYLYLLKDPQ